MPERWKKEVPLAHPPCLLGVHQSRRNLGLGVRVLLFDGNEGDLLVCVFRRSDEDLLGVRFEDEDVVNVVILAATPALERTDHEDRHDPHHAQKDADTTS